ncbi:MAG: hypothetical protein M3388_05915 [Acidobacteriota bacterium]|nr:hypothetical protein [Acidobacteriota bacterium]
MLSKKIIVLAAALFAVCLFGQTFSQAQSRQSKVLYAEPSRLMLPGDENASMKKKTGSCCGKTFIQSAGRKTACSLITSNPPTKRAAAISRN